MDSTHPRSGQDAGDGDRNPVDVLAESFLERLRRGEYPAISEYTMAYPELAEEIQSVFPTLAMLEQGGEGLTTQPPPKRPPSVPAQIGEYQILCEVGRGGMGIVYQPEHDTMRRRVALKVLPARSALDELQLQRFYLEARLAGRLHHSNIVPVFEVGTDGVYHYYAMQFIHGQSLDVVFDELRRIRGIVPPTPTTHRSSPHDGNGLVEDLAASLISGQFARTPLQDSADPTEYRELDDDRTVPSNSVVPADRLKVMTTEVTNGNLPALPLDYTFDVADSISADLNSSSQNRDDYFLRVARIGLQVAEALSYAHDQGILHRDIKPSNLILDTTGRAWVTDFGLAKDEDGALTRSGDIMGTYRYMAPERFDGHTDARSDIYGLGLTLYELCTLHNAFRADDSPGLVREICNTEPTLPRKLNPLIPRDLETIILKAISKRPGNRYQAARHMAEDFRLLLADHPVKARRRPR